MSMDIKNYYLSGEYAAILNPPVTQRRVRQMCKNGDIKGAVKLSRDWLIPKKSKDTRKKNTSFKHWHDLD